MKSSRPRWVRIPHLINYVLIANILLEFTVVENQLRSRFKLLDYAVRVALVQPDATINCRGFCVAPRLKKTPPPRFPTQAVDNLSRTITITRTVVEYF